MGNQYIDYCKIHGKRQQVVLYVYWTYPYGTAYSYQDNVYHFDKLPLRDTQEQAQADLDQYAIANKLKRISYCEECRSEIVTDPLDNSTNQRFCSTTCIQKNLIPWIDSIGDDYEEDNDCIDKDCGCSEDEHCPLCCMFTFSPGSEECDFCEHYEECLELQCQKRCF